jgi:TRAP-type transport system small permease protein
MTKMFERLGWLLETAIALLLGVMVVMVFGNVFLRYAFNSGISISEELARWAFVWMTFLGAVLALKDNAHLGVDILVKMMPKAGQKICLIITQVMELGLVVLMFIGSWKLTIINLQVRAPTTRWPVAIFYSVGVLFAVLTIALLLSNLARLLRGEELTGSAGTKTE